MSDILKRGVLTEQVRDNSRHFIAQVKVSMGLIVTLYTAYNTL